MAVVTVAAEGYTGKADYYCTGTDDQLIINAAIEFVSSAYGGGTVQLLEGTFKVVPKSELSAVYKTAIISLANVSLIGGGEGTTIEMDVSSAGVTHNISVIGSFGAIGLPIDGARIENLKIAQYIGTASVAISTIGIFNAYSSNFIVSRVTIVGGFNYGIEITNASNQSKISNNFINGNSITTGNYGIAAYGSDLIVTGNIIKGIRSSTSFVVGIYAGSTGVLLSNNTIYDLSTSDGASECIGIWSTTDRASIASNRIESCKNSGTAANAYGFRIHGDKNSISSNYCYNNGSDTGIENTNSKNFSDSDFSGSSTDTQCYSNSWQSPVASEPSLGTPHPCESTDSTLLLNQVSVAGTWYTITFAHIPVGTKKVKFPFQMFVDSRATAAACYYRKYGSGIGQTDSRRIAAVYSTATQRTMSMSQVDVPVDSAGRVDVSCDDNSITMQAWDAIEYSC
jgi:hypothetical protein